MFNQKTRYQYLSVITLVVIFILGIYTKDFWIDRVHHTTTGAALGKIKFKKAVIDSLVQIGDENRFLITGDWLDESYTFVGYSKDIDNRRTPIIIKDTQFSNPLSVKGKSVTVGLSDHYAYLSDKNHKPLSLTETFIRQDITVRYSVIILLLCVLLFWFFYFNSTSSSVTAQLYTMVKYITVPAGIFTMIISIFMLISWFNCFRGSEKYRADNGYKKYEMLVDSFNTGRVSYTTWKRSASPSSTFLGYSGDAYASKLRHYKIKIDVDEIMLLTDTLKKPIASHYIVWYNNKTQHAFMAGYMEQNNLPKLSNKLYSHLFSKIMILFYIGIAMYGIGFLVLKTKDR